MFRQILIAHDGSDRAFEALSVAIDLAKANRARLAMICVKVLPDYNITAAEVVEEDRLARDALETIVARATKLAARKGVRLNSEIRQGHPVRTILDCVGKYKADLLVIGFHGHAALFDNIMGGTSDRLMRLAACSVLVVK